MFPTNGTSHLTIGTVWQMEKAHVIIVVANNIIQISRILVMRKILRRPRRSAQLVGEAMDAVADTKVTARSGAGEMIIRTGIEMIMETVFKRGEILGCAISVVKSA